MTTPDAMSDLMRRTVDLLERLLRGEHELCFQTGPGPHENQADRIERFEDDARELLSAWREIGGGEA